MTHVVGALPLPVPVPAVDAVLADPCIDILGDFYSALLTKYLGTAWLAVAPGEPVVRSLYKGYNPEELDFAAKHLPVLALWREADATPSHLYDGHAETQTAVNLLWILPPTPQDKDSRRYSFFSAFDKLMALIVANERDPGYVYRDDAESDDPVVKLAAETYGSNVQRLCGIDWWRLQRVTRVPVVIQDAEYRGYMATWIIAESSDTDPTQFTGVAKTSIYFDLTDQAGDDALIRQNALIPPDP